MSDTRHLFVRFEQIPARLTDPETTVICECGWRSSPQYGKRRAMNALFGHRSRVKAMRDV